MQTLRIDPHMGLQEITMDYSGHNAHRGERTDRVADNSLLNRVALLFLSVQRGNNNALFSLPNLGDILVTEISYLSVCLSAAVLYQSKQ